MDDSNKPILQPVIELMDDISDRDLEDLCIAVDEAVLDGNGFGWLKPPERSKQKSFWRGVVTMPMRELYCARFEGRIVGSAQLIKPFANNEAGAHIANISTFFIAPYARGHGLAIGMLEVLVQSARKQGFKALEVDVRETQKAAISLIENSGFVRWGVKKKYAWNGERFVSGFYYTKDLEEVVKL